MSKKEKDVTLAEWLAMLEALPEADRVELLERARQLAAVKTAMPDLIEITDDDGPELGDRAGDVTSRSVTIAAQSRTTDGATVITGDADRSVSSIMARLDRTAVILIALVATGFILRLAALGIPELWYDEAFGRLITLLPFNRMIAATAGDVHPPLWYIFMWFWVRLVGHNSEFLFRLPSVAFSLAAIPVAWRLMKHFGVTNNNPTRLVVAAWLALGPFELYFGQEGRMYALLQLVFLVAVLAARECRWWVLGISTVALLYTHNYGLFYVATLVGLMALIYFTGPFNRMYPIIEGFISLSIAGLFYVPWLIFVLMKQMTTISSGYWIEPVTPGAVVYTLTIFLFGPFTRQFVLAATLVAVGLLVWSVIKLGRHAAPLYWLAAAPAVMAITAGLLWRPLYLWRGLIGSAPFLLMIVIPPMVDLIGWRRWYVAAIVAPVFLAGFAGHWLDINAFKSTTLEAVRRIQAEWQPGDILYSSNDGNWVMFTTYFPNQPVYLMPQCTDHDRGALSDLTRKALGVEEAPIAQIDHGRAWFLWNYGAPTSWCNYAKAAGLVGDTPPWWLVESSRIMEAGIWLLKK